MYSVNEIVEKLSIKNKRNSFFKAKKMVAFIESAEMEMSAYELEPHLETLGKMVAFNFGFITKFKWDLQRNSIFFGDGLEIKFTFSPEAAWFLESYFEQYICETGVFRYERSDDCLLDPILEYYESMK